MGGRGEVISRLRLAWNSPSKVLVCRSIDFIVKKKKKKVERKKGGVGREGRGGGEKKKRSLITTLDRIGLVAFARNTLIYGFIICQTTETICFL